MFHKLTPIVLLDVKKSDCLSEGTISDFIRSHAHLIKNNCIKLQNIVTMQNFSWTNLVSIEIVNNNEKWFTVSYHDKKLLVSESTIFPVYDYKNPCRKFHGSIEYPVQFKYVTELTDDDYLRIFNIDNEFTTVDVEPSDYIGQGIVLNTVSNSISMNGLHVWLSDKNTKRNTL